MSGTNTVGSILCEIKVRVDTLLEQGIKLWVQFCGANMYVVHTNLSSVGGKINMCAHVMILCTQVISVHGRDPSVVGAGYYLVKTILICVQGFGGGEKSICCARWY